MDKDLQLITDKILQKQEEYDKLDKEPIYVRFNMSGPISFVNSMTLDGLLSYSAMYETIGEDIYNIQDVRPTLDAPLPMKRVENCDTWWWSASQARYKLLGESLSSWKKRWDEEYDYFVKEPTSKMLRINHKSGHYKAYNMPLLLRHVDFIDFCCVGNKKVIENLASQIKNIGKKRSQGYGLVKSVIVEEAEYDWSCYYKDRLPSRPIPVSKEDKNIIRNLVNKDGGLRIQKVTYRPPYWDHARNSTLCYIPC